MKPPLDLSLYLVAQCGELPEEDFLRIVRLAIEGGVSVVQLREKEASTREICARGRALQALLRPRGIPLIINDRVDIAHALQAEGVHLGQSDLTVKQARALLGKDAIIGLSVETLEHVAQATGEEVDYLAASPVFQTQTKSNCSAPWGLEGLKQACALSSHPMIAIGGMDASRVDAVFACGVVGVAVVSAIFHAPCPFIAAQSLKQLVKKE